MIGIIHNIGAGEVFVFHGFHYRRKSERSINSIEAVEVIT
jgi:hypothetical protein